MSKGTNPRPAGRVGRSTPNFAGNGRGGSSRIPALDAREANRFTTLLPVLRLHSQGGHTMSLDSYVERPTIQVLRTLADMHRGGPAEAMQKLESRLSSIKGRRFYGAFRVLPEGEEYFACVERQSSDDPVAMELDAGEIPGGLYVRRKVFDWSRVIAAGKLPSIFKDMIRQYDVDKTRPELEYYRSRTELHILIPVRSRDPSPLAWAGSEV